MKKLFKTLLILLTFTLLFSNTIIVNADTTYSIEIENSKSGHTYEAYQIFTGDLSNDKTILSNIVWGSGVASTFTSGKDATTYANGITDANKEAKAKELGQNLSSTIAGTTNTLSNGKYTISGLTPGYYLIKDKDNTLGNANDAYTDYIIKLVGDTTVAAKSSIPTVSKKIEEGSNLVSYSANYKFGDTVDYVLTGTMPSNYDSYTSYKYVFHDTLASGFTLDTNSFEVYVGNTQLSSSNYTVATSGLSNGESFTVTITDTKQINTIDEDSEIIVKYSATVNNTATIGSTGNSNDVFLEYSNNPNKASEVGKSAVVETKVYLLDLIINKLDENSNALNGAGFKLQRLENGNYVDVETITNANSNVFTFSGLSVGTYKLTETTTPDGYNTITPLTIVVSGTVDQNGFSSLSGTGLTFTANTTAGTLTGNITNVKGTQLPFTGGNGTVIFTVSGAALIAISAIVLVKQHKKKNK